MTIGSLFVITYYASYVFNVKLTSFGLTCCGKTAEYQVYHNTDIHPLLLTNQFQLNKKTCFSKQKPIEATELLSLGNVECQRKLCRLSAQKSILCWEHKCQQGHFLH